MSKRWRLLALIPVIIIGYFIYDALYPSEEFYAYDFNEITGVELTEKAEFNYKTASFPDHFGDYNSVSIINVGPNFYETLIVKLSENGHSENGQRIGCNEMDKAKANLNGLKIEREFSKEEEDKFYYVAFLSDKESVLVQRSSH
ncbi:hypothetical protein [Zobellia nedashkovskayae]|uniref:hypothetical protein n=1 Tax=Zobellia nedashkovskayae TaxID=2779510 RepID=UPI00188CDE72|nr:hypothetical protein [Zobellia nedashkovskayae]